MMSIEYALNKVEIKIENPQDLYKFVGPPLLDSFKHYVDSPISVTSISL